MVVTFCRSFNSGCETSTEEEESSEPESSGDVWCKTDKKPSIELFLWNHWFDFS